MRPLESSPQRMIDVREVATILNVSTRTVRRLASNGTLPQPIRFGRNVRWRLTDIDMWIANRGAFNQSKPEKR